MGPRFAAKTLGAGLAVVALTATVGATTARADYVPAAGNGTLTTSDVCVGSAATFGADGFAAGAAVRVTVGERAATSVVADSAGAISYTITPGAAGSYAVTATGATPPPGDATRTATATLTVSDCPAGTGATPTPSSSPAAGGSDTSSGDTSGSDTSSGGALGDAAGLLPHTGAAGVVTLLTLGSLLTVAGLALVLLRRRRFAA